MIDLPRGTSPPTGGLAATDLAGWRTVAEARAEIGCSKRTIERLAAARKLEQRLRPTAGSPAVAVYNPDDVARIASERHPVPSPFVLPAGVTSPVTGNGNGHQVSGVSGLSKVSHTDDLIRGLAVLLSKALQSPPSPPVAEKVAETLFLTIPEAAAYAGLPATDIRRACASGELPARQTGRGGWRIRRKDLEAL